MLNWHARNSVVHNLIIIFHIRYTFAVVLSSVKKTGYNLSGLPSRTALFFSQWVSVIWPPKDDAFQRLKSCPTKHMD